MTKFSRLLAASLLCSLAVVTPALAQTVAINFETNAPELFGQTTPLTTRYSAQGVTFAGVDGLGGSILNDATFSRVSARSGTDFLAFNTGSSSGNTGLSERLTFSSTISAFSIYLAGGTAGASTFTATGFDANGLTLATTSAVTAAGGQYANLALGGFNFSQVLFTSSSTIFAADDLSFTVGPAAVAAVPEPAAWAMMIGGFGIVGGSLRRKRKVATTVSFA